eukprot:97361-Pelagomonas_calceolata.AAC.3
MSQSKCSRAKNSDLTNAQAYSQDCLALKYMLSLVSSHTLSLKAFHSTPLSDEGFKQARMCKEPHPLS